MDDWSAGLPALVSAIAVLMSMLLLRRNPWWAISSVSVNTLGESRFRDGPVQRTGTTPLSDHWATVVPSALFAEITAVIGCTLCSALVIQVVNLWLSGPTGRVSLMLLYFIRVGSCQTIMLLPPSSRCSSTTSRPRPSQLLNVPIDVLSSSTAKATPTAYVIGHRFPQSSEQTHQVAGPLAVQPQLGP